MIVVVMVLETTTASHLNNILQSSERCKVAISVGQRAADLRSVVHIPTHNETVTAPRLNNILQIYELCEIAIGVGQRAAD